MDINNLDGIALAPFVFINISMIYYFSYAVIGSSQHQHQQQQQQQQTSSQPPSFVNDLFRGSTGLVLPGVLYNYTKRDSTLKKQ